MSRTARAALLASALLAGLLTSGPWTLRETWAAEPLGLTCSAQTPTVPLGGTVGVCALQVRPRGAGRGGALESCRAQTRHLCRDGDRRRRPERVPRMRG